jgi:hypothetical protein
MLCTLQSMLTGEYSKAKRAEDTPQMILIELDPDAKWGPALLLQALWDWRDNMCDDSYDSDDSGCTQYFDETYLLGMVPPWPPKLPCGHTAPHISIK